MEIDALQDLYREFEGKWCRIYFVGEGSTLLKILRVSGDNLLCQNVHGSKKLISTYDIKNLEEFSGIIRASGEHVQNGLVVQKAIQNAT